MGAKHGYAIMDKKSKKLEYIKKVWDERDGPGKNDRSALFINRLLKDGLKD